MGHFKTPAENFTYVRSYSRWLEEEKRREYWPETVERYIDFSKHHLGDKVSQRVFKTVQEHVLNMGVMPSMRSMWAAGPALEQSNVCGYNCAFLPIDSIDSFSELLYCLMCGSGVGFSVQNVYIDRLPIVSGFKSSGAGTYIVQDTKEGWSDSVKALITALYHGQDLHMDYNEIRKEGSRLVVMGGRASGPAPLLTTHNFIREKFASRQGEKLSPIDCYDVVVAIAECVTMGDVRRASTISLSDLDDSEMSRAKEWPFPPRRSMANNSAIYLEKPTSGRFLQEWSIIANSGTGERGIFNLQAARANAPRRRDGSKILGCNPCQPGWATILTKDGIRRFDDVGVGSLIWSGKEWTKITAKAKTGVKPVYRYETNMGSFIGTQNHRVFQEGNRVEAKNAVKIDIANGPNIDFGGIEPADVLDGLVIGDGSKHMLSKDKVFLHIGNEDEDYFKSEIKDLLIGPHPAGRTSYTVITSIRPEELLQTYCREVPDRFVTGSASVVAGFLKGLFSANGTVNARGRRIELRQTSHKLVLQVQNMLSFLGIPSYITKDSSKTILFSNGKYTCKPSYKVNITIGRFRFMQKISFLQSYKNDKFDWESVVGAPKKSWEVNHVEYMGEHEVYDISVDCEGHHYWTGGCLVSNCAEVNLRPFQFCNLSEVVVRTSDDVDDLIDKVKAAVWMGAMQSTFTDFRYLRKIWKQNCEEERLLGISLTGQMDNFDLTGDPSVLRALKKTAIKTARVATKALGINMSAAVTCGKPSGTVSQMVGCASGCHPRYADHYIRRYRISASDPLFHMMKAQGVEFTPENGHGKKAWAKAERGDVDACPIFDGKKWDESKVRTWVCGFPIKSPSRSITRSQVSALDMLEQYKRLQENWCEHAQSCTIYVRDDEWAKVGRWVYDNWNVVNGVSFLLYDGGKYELAPYEEISKEKFKRLSASQVKIDFSKLSEFESMDSGEGNRTWACTGNKGCEV